MTPSTIDPTDPAAAIPDVPSRRGATPRDRVVAHALAADVARLHGEALLRTARRYAACADDAHDAYQRAMELLLEHAPTIDRAKAVGWMHVVVRREAAALSRHQGRTVPLDGEDVEEAMMRLCPVPEEQDHAIDLAQRAGEALATLKDAEAQALCLRAQGMSYDEIAELNGWSYTKVNRAVTEGRRAFVAHYMAVESGIVCGDTAELISRFVAGALKPRVAIRMRAHLVRCSACRALLHAERGADTALRALLPPVVIAAASHRSAPMGWLHDHLLGPIGHAAGRLQPAADHLLGSKVGLAAASTIAIAGGGLAAQDHVARHAAPPPILRSGLVGAGQATPGTDPAATPPIERVVNTAVDTGRTIQTAARRRAAARKRAATAKRNAATKARRIANEREFARTASEFDSTTKNSAARAARADASTTGTVGSTAAPTEAPTTEVPTTGTQSDSTVDVVTEDNTPSASSGGSGSGEFSP